MHTGDDAGVRRTEEIDRVIERVLAVLAERLAPTGWRRRPIGRPATGTFTRPVRAGVIETLAIHRRGITFPETWPVSLSVVPGVGAETALALWPLLGRAPRADITWDRATGGPNGTDVDLDGEPETGAFVERVVELLDGPARAFADSFADLDALVVAQRGRRARRSAAAAADAPAGSPEGPSMADLVLVLATGRRGEARAVLAEVAAGHAADGGPGLDRRFARQVRRRLDAGNDEVPPLEETLALLPSPRTPTPSSWSTIRAEQSARREARTEVSGRAGDRSAEEVLDDLAGEYAVRGLEVRRSVLAVAADQILLAQRPLGRVRVAVTRTRELALAGREIVHRFRTLDEEEPDWLRPPDRAAYPLRDHHDTGHAPVVLDPGVDELLELVQGAARLRVVDAVQVEVWFTAAQATRDEPAVVVAHIGAHRVGVVPAEQAAGFPAVFRAAALFDEDPVVAATLVRAGGHTWYLDVDAPEAP